MLLSDGWVRNGEHVAYARSQAIYTSDEGARRYNWRGGSPGTLIDDLMYLIQIISSLSKEFGEPSQDVRHAAVEEIEDDADDKAYDEAFYCQKHGRQSGPAMESHVPSPQSLFDKHSDLHLHAAMFIGCYETIGRGFRRRDFQ